MSYNLIIWNPMGDSKSKLYYNGVNRINGFNIYRDDQLLAWVPTEENTYIDGAIQFGIGYCYKVKAIYEDGESNPTSTECGTVIDPDDFSVVNLSGFIFLFLDNITSSPTPLNLFRASAIIKFSFLKGKGSA